MDRIKEILNKYIQIKRIGKHGKFAILNTNIATLEKKLKERSEQLKCRCKKPDFTRDCDDYFNIICGKCGNTL